MSVVLDDEWKEWYKDFREKMKNAPQNDFEQISGRVPKWIYDFIEKSCYKEVCGVTLKVRNMTDVIILLLAEAIKERLNSVESKVA